MEKENKSLSDEKRAETFEVNMLIGKSWDDISYIINKNKKNGFIMQKIADNQEFKDYCKQQAEKFLDYKIALRDRDVKAVDVLWLYGDLELEVIHKIQERLEKNDYLSSDKFRDLATDKTLKLFAENIEEIQEEMEMPVKGSEFIRRHERQKLVDYIRFMEGGNKSKEMFEKGDWKFFQNEYNNFPKMRTPFLIELYKKAEEKNSNSDRLKLMGRIMFYRFDDINSGRRKLFDEEEMAALEQFIDPDTKIDTAANVLEKIKTAREEKAARLKEKEKEEKQKAEAQRKEEKITKEEAEDKISEKETEDKNIAKKKEAKQKSEPLVIDEEPENIVPVKVKKEENTDNKMTGEAEDKTEIQSEEKGKAADAEKTDKDKGKEKSEENKEDKTETPEKTSKEETVGKDKQTDAKEEDKEPENWREDTFNDWKNWGRAHRKWVQSYEDENNKGGLSLKISANKTASEKNDFEAQIIYRKHNHITVKGKDGKVPGNDIFDGIIAAAKNGSRQISFGNIKSDEFKARLMLACLIEPEIEMINAPKIEDLKNIPEDLMEALKNPAKRKAEIANQKRENLDRQKNGGERKPYNKDGGKPRREYTDEEKAAYRARQAKKSAEI